MTRTSIVNCGVVFSVLPFTTVNMTELAFWSASAPSIITTPINASVGGIGSNPARGYVYSASSTANGTVNNITTVNELNSGLTGITSQAATTLTDSTANLLDQRQYVVGNGGGGGGGGGGSSVYFDVALSGLAWMASQNNLSLDPSVAWSATAAQMGTAVAATNTVSFQTGNSGSYVVTYAGGSTTTRFTPTGCTKHCTTTTTNNPNAATPTSPVTAPVGLTVTVQKFNSYDNAGSASGTCTAESGGSSGTFTTTVATRCFNYAVDTANVKVNATIVAGTTATLLTGTTDGGLLEGRSLRFRTLRAFPARSTRPPEPTRSRFRSR